MLIQELKDKSESFEHGYYDGYNGYKFSGPVNDGSENYLEYKRGYDLGAGDRMWEDILGD
jgi:hypothetical protein